MNTLKWLMDHNYFSIANYDGEGPRIYDVGCGCCSNGSLLSTLPPEITADLEKAMSHED